MKSRKHIQCNACKFQTGFTAGTIFDSTKLPFVTWFRAIDELTQAKGGISSIELARRLGVRQPTAPASQADFPPADGKWLMKQKLMPAPPGPPGPVSFGDRIEGLVAFDGAAGKTPFVAAVETTHDRQPRRLRLQVVKGFRKAEITKLAQSSFAPGSNVVSDGLRGEFPLQAQRC